MKKPAKDAARENRIHNEAVADANNASIDVAPKDNPTNDPEPDLIVLDRDFLQFTTNPHAEALRLVVEVSDTTLAFDLKTKAALYASAGIVEYWVLDVPRARASLFIVTLTVESTQTLRLTGQWREWRYLPLRRWKSASPIFAAEQLTALTPSS